MRTKAILHNFLTDAKSICIIGTASSGKSQLVLELAKHNLVNPLIIMSSFNGYIPDKYIQFDCEKIINTAESQPLNISFVKEAFMDAVNNGRDIVLDQLYCDVSFELREELLEFYFNSTTNSKLFFTLRGVSDFKNKELIKRFDLICIGPVMCEDSRNYFGGDVLKLGFEKEDFFSIPFGIFFSIVKIDEENFIKEEKVFLLADIYTVSEKPIHVPLWKKLLNYFKEDDNC